MSDRPRHMTPAQAMAERTLRALRIFWKWNGATGCIPRGCSYEAEIESIVRDAVLIGGGFDPEDDE